MKRSLFVLVVSVTLFGAPALFGCEKCIPKGNLDPNGNGPYSTGICWTIDTGSYVSCYGTSTSCTTTSGDGCPAGGQCQSELGCILNPESIQPPAAAPAARKCSL